MHKSISLVVLSATLAGLYSCQPGQPVTSTPSQQPANASAAASTEAQARAAVARFVEQQPNAALYQLDSARVLEVNDHWQILVPRTDWAGRMPNKAAFDVDKQTGTVSPLAVK
ncbi:hypothetical protein [Hymenobacter sp. HDW8]|uniref:hypothetical protein n=1 Tax=Hymenobacter sp. HDW8 TaxID=2714932 RepID=UPI0014090AA2|nr:hypothetical protein [Hymenobacter sp. HDW8]QIL77527.1 hypothetical protein G7064_18030 [Hymenobacter sp. HDW8]